MRVGSVGCEASFFSQWSRPSCGLTSLLMAATIKESSSIKIQKRTTLKVAFAGCSTSPAFLYIDHFMVYLALYDP